jgi:hypothetical protein
MHQASFAPSGLKAVSGPSRHLPRLNKGDRHRREADMTEIYVYAASKEKFEYRPVGCRTGLRWWRVTGSLMSLFRKISMMPDTSNNEPRITSTFKFAIAPTVS